MQNIPRSEAYTKLLNQLLSRIRLIQLTQIDCSFFHQPPINTAGRVVYLHEERRSDFRVIFCPSLQAKGVFFFTN